MEGNLAVLGCGTMGEILVGAMLDSGAFQPEQIVATSRRPARREQLQAKYRISVSASNQEAADGADIILIAVKPVDVRGLLDELARTVTRRHLVVSIAAGVTTAAIEEELPMAGPLVRAMPNVAARVGEAVTVISPGERAGEPDLDKAEELFSCVGKVIRLPEHFLDAVTALSGSGPALFSFFAEAIMRAGEDLGLADAVAADLVTQTFLGTALLLRKGDMTPAELREAVTSRGGTTEAAIGSLTQSRVGEAIRESVKAAAQRARQLSQ